MKKRILVVLLLTICFSGLMQRSASAAWFNTKTGNVHVEGNINPRVPGSESFSQADVFMGGNESGIITYTGGALNMGNGSETFGAMGSVDLNTSPSAIKRLISPDAGAGIMGYGYEYYFSQFGTSRVILPGMTANCTDVGAALNSFSEHSILYFEGDLRIVDSGCDLNITKSFIVMVHGTITIHLDTLTVSPGKYLIMIGSESIDIHNSVLALEGVYIADERIIVNNPGTPDLFRGNGIFIGHTEIELNRNSGNATTPAEQFSYEPRFMVVAPNAIKRRRISSWENLAP